MGPKFRPHNRMSIYLMPPAILIICFLIEFMVRDSVGDSMNVGFSTSGYPNRGTIEITTLYGNKNKYQYTNKTEISFNGVVSYRYYVVSKAIAAMASLIGTAIWWAVNFWS